MNYKSYGNQKSTASRMARKRMRRDVFEHNRKAARLVRKAKRAERKSLELVE